MTFADRMRTRLATVEAVIADHGPDILICPEDDEVSPQFYGWGGACATHRRDCVAAQALAADIRAALAWAGMP